MPARICVLCGISFPAGVKECEACGETTKYDGTGTADEDWQVRVDVRRLASPEALRIRSWRERQLTGMGFRGACLEVLIDTTEVRLHDIEALLLRGCPHEQAARILL